MNFIAIRFSSVVLGLLAVGFSIPAQANHSETVSLRGKRAIVYSGDGACHEGCATASGDMAIRMGLTPYYVTEDSLTAQSTEEDRKELFANVAVWLQPGGYSSSMVNSMTSELKKAMINWVKQGGAYVGFCAGAFASTRFSGDMDYLGFGLIPGETSLYWNNGRSVDIIPVKWENQNRSVYFEGGPYIDYLDGKAEAVSYYANGRVAAAKSKIGKGRAFVAGFHPEAPQWWRDAYGMNDPDGLDFDMVDEMIRWTTTK